MRTTLERPEAVTVLRHRFDVDAYHRMAEVGILGSKDRVELVEGEIVDMAPIGSAHASTTDLLIGLVARAVADGVGAGAGGRSRGVVGLSDGVHRLRKR